MRGYFRGEHEITEQSRKPHEEVVWVSSLEKPSADMKSTTRLATIVRDSYNGKVLGIAFHQGGGKHEPYEIEKTDVTVDGDIITTKDGKLRIVKRDSSEGTKKIAEGPH